MAILYALNLWPALTRYYDNGAIETDNSDAERALLSIAIGRRNYLFGGAGSGGERGGNLLADRHSQARQCCSGGLAAPCAGMTYNLHRFALLKKACIVAF